MSSSSKGKATCLKIIAGTVGSVSGKPLILAGEVKKKN